jgi:AcrR family transcriptional regulator
VRAQASLRDDQRAVTRQRIVRAVSDLIADEHPATVSVPAVARRAGVGVATIYRYFPSKEVLLDAAAHEVVTPSAARLPRSFDELEASLAAAWGELEEQLPLVRGQFASPVGRELHRRRWETKHAAMAALLRAEDMDPDSDVGRRLLAVADVLTSSTALLELRDKAGIPVADAAAWCAWAVGVLHDASTKDHR